MLKATYSRGGNLPAVFQLETVFGGFPTRRAKANVPPRLSTIPETDCGSPIEME
jgi:hypothetical protein